MKFFFPAVFLFMSALVTYGQGMNSSTQFAVVKVKFEAKGTATPIPEGDIAIPAYPATQQQGGEAAEVEFELTLDENGHVSGVAATLIKAMDRSKSAFASSTVRAVKDWKFLPFSKQASGLKYPLKLRGIAKFEPASDSW